MEKRTVYKSALDIQQCAWCKEMDPDDFCYSCGGCTECCPPGNPSCIGGELPIDPAEDMSDDV